LELCGKPKWCLPQDSAQRVSRVQLHGAEQVHRLRPTCLWCPYWTRQFPRLSWMPQLVTRHLAKLQSLQPKQHGRRSNACPLLRYAHRRCFRGLISRRALFFLSAPCTTESQERGGTNARTEGEKLTEFEFTQQRGDSCGGPTPRRESSLSGQCPARCTSKPQACEAAFSVPFLVAVERAARRPLFCSVECRQSQKQCLGGDQISPG